MVATSFANTTPPAPPHCHRYQEHRRHQGAAPASPSHPPHSHQVPPKGDCREITCCFPMWTKIFSKLCFYYLRGNVRKRQAKKKNKITWKKFDLCLQSYTVNFKTIFINLWNLLYSWACKTQFWTLQRLQLTLETKCEAWSRWKTVCKKRGHRNCLQFSHSSFCVIGSASPLTNDNRIKSFKQAFSRMLIYWRRKKNCCILPNDCSTYKMVRSFFCWNVTVRFSK